MKKNRGFTIIELLVMISAFAIVSVVTVAFLSMTLFSSSKTIAIKEVRQNGNYAMSVIERLVLSAKSVTCLTTESIGITTLDDQSTTIGCSAGKIASGSAYLTNSKVTVANCVFSCKLNQGAPNMVGVGFTVSIGGASSPTHEKSSMSFQNNFIVRNQRD